LEPRTILGDIPGRPGLDLVGSVGAPLGLGGLAHRLAGNFRPVH
jgi:hypothetical protein